MAERELPARAVLGAEALVALAVPARYALLNHLLDVGPRTASECAEVVGESPSNCSWHLRALAKVGLVRRVHDAEGDARRRPWEATAVGFTFGGDDSPASRLAASAVESLAVEHQAKQLRRFLAARAHLPAEWAEAAALIGYSLLATPDEMRELVSRIDALARPYVRTIRADAPPGAAVFHLGLQGFVDPDLAGAR